MFELTWYPTIYVLLFIINTDACIVYKQKFEHFGMKDDNFK